MKARLLLVFWPLAMTNCSPASCPPCNTSAVPKAEPGSSQAPAALPDRRQQPPNTAATTETRTTQVIAAVIVKHRHTVRSCYETELTNQPQLRGTLTLRFSLDPSGKVVSAELNKQRSTLTSPAMVACAVSALKAMPFPASSRGFESTINYPFDFKP